MRDDSELEALLRTHVPLPRPSREARERVRTSFLDKSAETASRPSPELRTDEAVDTHLEQILASDRLAPPARRSFQDGLRQRFVGGEFELGAQPVVPALLADELEGPDESDGYAADAPPRGRLKRFLVVVAAVAAIFLVTLLPTPPRWEVRVVGDGPLLVAGQPFLAHEANRLSVELEQPRGLESKTNRVGLSLEDGLLQIEIQEFTTVDLPEPTPLDGILPVLLTLHSGEVYLKTLPGYPGNPVRVETPEGEIELRGTALGILAEKGGTCICVREGQVELRSPWIQGKSQLVSAGDRFFVFAGGTMAPKREQLTPPGQELDEHASDLLRFTK